MAVSGHDSLGARRELKVGDASYDYFSLERAADQVGDASRLPYSLKVLLEKSYSFDKLYQDDSAAYYLFQGQRIFAAMYYSGAGISEETPTFALGPADGQDYVTKFVGAKITNMSSGNDHDDNFLDIIDGQLDDGRTLTFYFIVQHAADRMLTR